MKKAMAILLAAVLALACTACGGSKNGETKDRLAQIKEKGYIELCTEPYFAPYEYVDPNKSGEDQYQGMDIEVARYIADKIGVDLKITALDFTAVLAGVADGKYDFAISAIAYAPSRAEAMRLSDVYYSSNTGYGFIVRTEDIDKYNDLDSLKDAVVITQSGSVQEALYNQYINGACKEFKLVANMTDGYLAVAEGKADVCICSTASAQLYDLLIEYRMIADNRPSSFSSGNTAALAYVLQYIEEKYASQIKLGDLAETAGGTEQHLCRLFKKNFGLSPMEYLTKVRIQHAKEQLIYSPKTIGEIAVDTGFPDSSYFAVVFKKQEKLTPGEYRGTR